MHLNQNWFLDAATQVVFICSVLHTFLPPWDGFSDFPRFQKVYKVIVYVIGYGALNARSTVYKSISVNGGTPKA